MTKTWLPLDELTYVRKQNYGYVDSQVEQGRGSVPEHLDQPDSQHPRQRLLANQPHRREA